MKRPRSPALPRIGSPGPHGRDWAALADEGAEAPMARMTPQMIEQKRQILPHLEAIAYVQMQLDARLKAKLAASQGKSRKRRRHEPEQRCEEAEVEARRAMAPAHAQAGQQPEGEPEVPSPRAGRQQDEDEKLYARFPRFCRLLDLRDFGSAPVQSLHWVLQTVEEMYDARERAFMRALSAPDAKHNEDGGVRLVPFPEFAFAHLRQAYGLEQLASQAGWSLVLSLSCASDWPKHKQLDQFGTALDMFSQFLRETWDEDRLEFYLLARRALQQRLAVRLSAETKPEQQQHKDAGVAMVPRSCMMDEVFLDETAVRLLTEALLEQVGGEPEQRGRLAEFAAKRVLWRWEAARCKRVEVETPSEEASADLLLPPIAARQAKTETLEGVLPGMLDEPVQRPDAARARPAGRYIAVSHALRALVASFEEIPDDIVKLVKHDDGGNRMQVLDQLKGTLEVTKERDAALADVDEAHVTLRSHRAKVARLELKCKLETDEANSKHRTALFLAKNDLWRHEQHVARVEAKAQTLAKRVEQTWGAIMAADPKEQQRRQRTALEGGLSPKADAREQRLLRRQHLLPATRMFALWMDRQVKRHGHKTAAVKKLRQLGGWKQQMEARQEQAALLVQRAWRARQEQRRLEAEARAIAESKRAELRRKRKANQRLRVQQEERGHQHRRRLKMREQQEVERSRKLDKRRAQIVAKHREAEAERRWMKNRAKLVARCFAQWKRVLSLGRHQRQRQRHQQGKYFAEWRRWLVLQRVARAKRWAAATQLTRLARGFLARQRAAQLRREKAEHQNKVTLNVRRMLLRAAARALRAWREYVEKRQRASTFLQRTLASLLSRAWEAWRREHTANMAEKRKAAVRIQNAFRAKQARQALASYRTKWRACQRIQGAWRAFTARTILERCKRQQEAEMLKINTSLRRIRWRRSYAVFQSWVAHTRQCKHVRTLFNRQSKQRRRELFRTWRAWVRDQRDLRQRMAVRIQSRWRSQATLRTVRRVQRQHESARKVQALVRGRRDRARVLRLYWQHQHAKRIQRIWRGRCGRRKFNERLSAFLLSHATPDKVSTVKFAIEKRHIDPRRLVDASTGDTLLHRACLHGSKRIVKMCLRAGMKLTCRNRKRQQPLHMLAIAPAFLGQDVFADYIMAKGADINGKDARGRTPVMCAVVPPSARSSNLTLLNLFTQHAQLETRDKDGLTALHLAALRRQPEAANLLLAAGASIYCADNATGATPLHALAALGRQSMLGVFLPQYYAAAEAYYEENKPDGDEIAIAHDPELAAAAAAVSEAAAQVGLDVRDAEGRTALHYACKHGQLETAKLLIAWGADPNAVDNDSRAAAWYAAWNLDLPMLEYLVGEGGADLNLSTCAATGNTPLHCACLPSVQAGEKQDEDEGSKSKSKGESGSESGSESSTWGGESTESSDEAELTAQQISERRVEVVRYLLKCGASVDVQNKAGDMPAHLAAAADDAQLLKLLVYFECEMNVKNYSGQTVLGVARMNNAEKVIEYINSRFIERDRKEQWQLEEQRRGEALTALFGQVRFTRQIGKQHLLRGHERGGILAAAKAAAAEHAGPAKKKDASVDLAMRLEREKAEAMPKLELAEWQHLHDTRGELEVEMGVLTESAWQRFRVLGRCLDEQLLERQRTQQQGLDQAAGVADQDYLAMTVPRADDDLTGASFWFNPDKQVYQWATPVEVFDLPEALDEWEQRWDEAGERLVFYNTRTGEERRGSKASAPPAATGGKYLEKRVAKKRRALPRRGATATNTSVLLLPEADVLDDELAELEGINLNDYQQYWEQENEEMRMRLEQEAAAVLLQGAWRRRQAAIAAYEKRVLRDAATRLQSNWRALCARRAAERLRIETEAATVVQRYWRTFSMRRWFQFELARLRLERAQLHSTKQFQRIWRGYVARRTARRRFARTVDPAPQRLEDWTELVRNLEPIDSCGIFDEYLVRWPDVKCYINRLTGAGSWGMPKDMYDRKRRDFDELWSIIERGFTRSEEAAAVLLQNRFRGKRMRKQFQLILHGTRIMRAAENAYLEHPFHADTCQQDPQGVINLCNYALYMHTMEEGKVDKARTLLARAYQYMLDRGPDNAFVLFAYGIFLASQCEDEFIVIQDYMDRAWAADPSGEQFKLAEAGFYRQATLDRPSSARALLNYALCLQWYGTSLTRKGSIQPELDMAEQYYLEALSLAPQDTTILENFDYMLAELKCVDYDGFGAFREYQEKRAAAEAAAATQLMERQGQAEAMRTAASNVQRIVRGFMARRSVWRLVSSRWEEWQDESGHTFYYRSETAESTWTAPFGLHLGPKTVPAAVLEATDQSTPWYVCEDDDGETFYYNGETGESVWELPPGFVEIAAAPEWEALETEEGETYYYNATTGESTWDNRVVEQAAVADDDIDEAQQQAERPAAGLPPEWEALQDAEGSMYFHNTVTGETTWDPPVDLLTLGQFVFGQFEGGELWYPGRIVGRRENSTFDIAYDDGDAEEEVARDFIVVRDAPEIELGTPVHVVVNDRYFDVRLSGVVQALGATGYAVLFDDGEEEGNVQPIHMWPLRHGEDDDHEAVVAAWEQKQSASGLPYFANSVLGVAQWDPPATLAGSFEPSLDFKALFELMDEDGSGKLSRQELLRSLGDNSSAKAYIEQVPGLAMLRDAEFLRMLGLALDAGGSGITAGAFESQCVRLCREQQLLEDLAELFSLLDGDGSASLDCSELDEMLQRPEVLQMVRLRPSVAPLLRPSALRLVARELGEATADLDTFVSYAQAALAQVADKIEARQLWAAPERLAERLPHRPDLAAVEGRAAFEAECTAALGAARRRREALMLFRMVDEDESRALGRDELWRALENEHVRRWVRRQRGLRGLVADEATFHATFTAMLAAAGPDAQAADELTEAAFLTHK